MEVADEFVLRGPGANARGALSEKGFVVKAGSLARREVVPSAKSVGATHQRLKAEGVLVEEGDYWRFATDYEFNSPSGAASAVLARNANGWTEWKRADGRSLSDVMRVARDARTHVLTDSQQQAILSHYELLLSEGKLPTTELLDREQALFRERFGPAVLASLDGEALLKLLHETGNHDSLMYWLEFKNDDEFGTTQRGSILGGSSLKFRVYRRKETGKWHAAGDNPNVGKEVSVEDAINIARQHRDQLVRGCELLESLREHATDDDYALLQDQMDELAPDVSRLAWGHKYFSLLFPQKLDDFHVEWMQRFHLLKLLQLPPDRDGRYITAGRFVAAARETGLCMNHLTTVLNSLHGSRHRYWRIGTTDGETGESFWPMMRDGSCVAIGWEKVGDLSEASDEQGFKETLKDLLRKHYSTDAASYGRTASQLMQFVRGLGEGDIVLAADGMKILGIGRVRGGYEYQPEFSRVHQRAVDWLTLDEWQLPVSNEGLRSTFRELRNHSENLLAIEQRLQAKHDGSDLTRTTVKPSIVRKDIRLDGIPGRIQQVLERKGQVILYGPPGTGKTYWAERTTRDLAAIHAFGKFFQSLDDTEQAAIIGRDQQPGLVRFCCFHPAYGYEDFIEGYRPLLVNGVAAFELRSGVFKRLCKDAAAEPQRHFYLIVDEINRGDIPRIFGELLTILEKDKRTKSMLLPVSQESFSVPKNVFVVGTMNTADRSISLLDAALRRRFGFVELMPDPSVLRGSVVAGILLQSWLKALNARIQEHVGRDARNLQIGHSYFMHDGHPLRDLATLKRVLRDDVIPLLEEYCYEDYKKLAAILGDHLVDENSKHIRHELFEDIDDDKLIAALVAPCPEVVEAETLDAVSDDDAATEDDETESL